MHDQREPGTDIAITERNDIMGLRGLLMTEIRNLGANASKQQMEVAKVKCEISQTIINSIKAETLFLQVAKKAGSRFIPVIDAELKEPGSE